MWSSMNDNRVDRDWKSVRKCLMVGDKAKPVPERPCLSETPNKQSQSLTTTFSAALRVSCNATKWIFASSNVSTSQNSLLGNWQDFESVLTFHVENLRCLTSWLDCKKQPLVKRRGDLDSGSKQTLYDALLSTRRGSSVLNPTGGGAVLRPGQLGLKVVLAIKLVSEEREINPFNPSLVFRRT